MLTVTLCKFIVYRTSTCLCAKHGISTNYFQISITSHEREYIDELQELNRRIVSLIDERSANTVSQKTLNQKNTLKLCQRTGSFKVIYCILLI